MRIALLALVAALWIPAPAGAEDVPMNVDGPDWAALADVETVEVVSADEGGTTRETTVWLAVVDGQGYIRTGGSTWGDNVVRDPDIAVRFGEVEYRFRVEFVEDEAARERIVAAFREKYGFPDVLAGLVRGSHPKIMRLTQP